MTTTTLTQRELHRALRADAHRWEDAEIPLDLARLAIMTHEAATARAAEIVRSKIEVAVWDARVFGAHIRRIAEVHQ